MFLIKIIIVTQTSVVLSKLILKITTIKNVLQTTLVENVSCTLKNTCNLKKNQNVSRDFLKILQPFKYFIFNIYQKFDQRPQRPIQQKTHRCRWDQLSRSDDPY